MLKLIICFLCGIDINFNTLMDKLTNPVQYKFKAIFEILVTALVFLLARRTFNWEKTILSTYKNIHGNHFSSREEKTYWERFLRLCDYSRVEIPASEAPVTLD